VERQGERYGIITAEYSTVEVEDRKLPCIVLVARRVENPRKKVYYRVAFRPHFYIEDSPSDPKRPNTILRSFGVYREEYTQARSLYGKPLRKVYVKDPSRVKNILEFLRKASRSSQYTLYDVEMALPSKLPLHFLIEKGLKSGFKIEGNDIIPCECDVPLRVWIFDIEANSKLLTSVNPERDEPIIMFTFWDSYTNQYVTVHTHPKDFKPLLDNHIVIRVPSERCLLLYLQGCLDKKYNPDVLAAHNLLKYDLVKWLSRLEHYGLKKNSISPKPFRRVDLRRYPAKVEGRIICDLLEALKAFTLGEFRSYALESLIEELELSTPKVPFYAPISELWSDTASISYDEIDDNLKPWLERVKDEFRPSYIVLLRNLLDVIATKEYNEKYGLIEFYDALRKEVGGLFEDMLIHHRVIETGIRRMIHEKIALPSKFAGSKSESYKGAFVFEPTPGLYENVVCLDFSREYPNIIQKLNISPETYVPMPPSYIGREEEFRDKMREKGYHVIFKPKEIIQHENYVEEIRAQVYVFKRRPIGIIPKWNKRAFKMRDKYEELERKAHERGEEEKAKVYSLKATLAKIAANASYGYMSYQASPLYKRECAAATALAGHIASKQLINIIQRKGYRVIYGDTDSSFFQLKGDETLEDIQRLVDELNREMAEWCCKEWNVKESPFKLSIKKIYSRFIILTKKRYGGKYIWDEKKGYTEGYDFKGLELVRTDSSDVERELQERIVKLVLDNQQNKIRDAIREVLIKLARREYSPTEVAYPEGIKKRLEKVAYEGKEYWSPIGYKKSVPAHIRAAIYSNQYLGTDFRTGDKPRRLPIHMENLQNYPKYVAVYLNGEVKRLKVRDIAIEEYYPPPKEFEALIDWQRIEKRLRNKIDALLDIVSKNERVTLDNYFK